MDQNSAYGEYNVIQLPSTANLGQLIQHAAALSSQQQQQSISNNQSPIIMLQLVSQPGSSGNVNVSCSSGFSQNIASGSSATAEDEPLYVNAKQYYRILKRRADRAKLEKDGRIPKERRKYMHESRHLHAVNRARGEGGRFNSGSKRQSGNFSDRMINTRESPCVVNPTASTIRENQTSPSVSARNQGNVSSATENHDLGQRNGPFCSEL